MSLFISRCRKPNDTENNVRSVVLYYNESDKS